MANIPVYDQSVGLQSGGTPTPRLTPMTEAASGVNVQEAAAGVGKTVMQQAEGIGHILAYKSRLDAQENAYNTVADVSKDFEQRAKGDNGWLTRVGANAKGIAHGTDPQKLDPESFEGWYGKAKSEALKGRSPVEQKMITRLLDSHGNAWRNSVMSHEAHQGQIARDDAFKASLDAAANTFALDPEDKAAVGVFSNARMELQGHLNGQPPEVIAQHMRDLTDHFAKAAVAANVENDPEKAQKAMDLLGPHMNEASKGALQSQLDGKMIELRTNAMWDKLSQDPQNRNPDGSYKLGDIEKKAMELAQDRPERERMRYVKSVAERARMEDSALVQTKQQNTRAIYDEISKLRDKGVLFPQAEKAVLSKYGNAFGPSELDDIRSKAVEVWSKSPAGVDARLKAMNPEQQAAYSEAVDALKLKYKNKKIDLPGGAGRQDAAPAVIKTLSERAPGMQPAQIRQWVKDQTADVPTHPPYLTLLGHEFMTGSKPQWQVQRSLEMQYGRPMVASAIKELAGEGKPFGYPQLEDRLKSKKR